MAGAGDEPVIIVPTSGKKKPGGNGSGWLRSFPQLDPRRHDIADALERYLKTAGATTSAHHASNAKALQRNHGLLDRPTMPAIERYDNTLFSTIGYESLTAEARSLIDRQLIILSGLWGALRSRDQIPDYFLPMTVKLPPLGLLDAFWRDELQRVIDPVVDGRVVWDFLRNAYEPLWTSSGSPRHRLRLTVRFLSWKGKAVGHRITDASIYPRGELIRFIATHSATSIDDLATFESTDGWRVDQGKSFHNGISGAVVLRKY